MVQCCRNSLSICTICLFTIVICTNIVLKYVVESDSSRCLYYCKPYHLKDISLRLGNNAIHPKQNGFSTTIIPNIQQMKARENSPEEQDSADTNRQQYIRYRFNKSGFANNIFGMISAYVVATLVNATLIFESNSQFQYVFSMTNVYGQPIESPNIVRVANTWVKQRYEFDCVNEKQKRSKLFMHTPLKSLFKDQLIEFYSNCPLFTWIVYNEENYSRLIQLGLLENLPFSSHHPSIHGFHLLSTILRKHLQFTSIVEEYASKNLGNRWDPTNRVGVHIRMGDEQSDFKETRVFLKESDIVQFLNCTILKTMDRPQLYLASDSQHAKQVFRTLNKEFGYPFISSNRAALHTSLYTVLADGPSEALFTSVADLISLAQTEAVIGTEFSSYSIVAAALQGSLPYLVSKGGYCEQQRILSFNK